MSYLSVAQIIMEAQRLNGRVKDLDALGSALLVEAESNNRLVESLRRFQDDVDILNHVSNSKSNSDMVNRIHQQNANSSEILKENRELKVCLEDYERAMELIMQKYREHASSKVLDTQTNLKDVYNEQLWMVIRDQREKINEMAAVMQHAASVDDATINRYLETMSNLQKENKTLRELLQISKQFGSAYRPIRINELFLEEKSVQTEADELSADELSISGASVENANNNTVIHMKSNSLNTSSCTADIDVPTVENTLGENNNSESTLLPAEMTQSSQTHTDAVNEKDVTKSIGSTALENRSITNKVIMPSGVIDRSNTVGDNCNMLT